MDKFIGHRANIGARIFDNYETLTANSNISKCSLSSYATLGERSAKLILASASPITVEDARKFVFDDLNRKMIPVAGTFSCTQTPNHMGLYYASIIASKASYIVEPFDANASDKSCLNASATMFLDQNLGCTWERKSINGQDCFVRNNEEDIEGVLRACMSASVETRTDVEQFKPRIEAGNFVTYVGFEGAEGVPFIEIGEVTKVTANTVTVNMESEGIRLESEIPAHAILTVIPVEAAASEQEVLDYLTRAYGPRFADVVKKTGAFKGNGGQGLIKE